MGEIRDIIVDCLEEEGVINLLDSWGEGRLIMDPEHPEDPFLDDDGYLTIRFRNPTDIHATARQIERSCPGLQVIEIVDPMSAEVVVPPQPGSVRAQRALGLLNSDDAI